MLFRSEQEHEHEFQKRSLRYAIFSPWRETPTAQATLGRKCRELREIFPAIRGDPFFFERGIDKLVKDVPLMGLKTKLRDSVSDLIEG